MTDSLILSQCHFNCRIGCTAEERAEVQTIILDVTLFFDITKAARSGDLADTIDYCLVHEAVKNLVERQEFNLIETMITAVAELLLQSFPIQKVTLRLQKPGPMLDRGGAWAGLEITRP